ncbi:hypothetical protein G6F70_003879 [Rhizopus microsporus]|uniref:Uncharacterized protein n=1 Tax=Rhizopus microsporus TaxID=58291 RepID=A0A1X0SFM6_RHIZD|nr:hypothetical protein G6F71_003878 [Rhizopus microsporus]KAG1200639.1 hypothetical protein G6F70_003879 [Rhizopus microsporus]KAG1216441.1 hypothetical protein G6F69_000012 [Rhizopus microsporus]KAG1234418.1 hypothetical protein G6F67_003544 [Rhizopus microsporus]KAG1266671.1 hypothetical protein G6F68_002553 [Rhizopus microsporus]
MTSQGVCPDPKCMPPQVLGLPSSDNSNGSNNSSNAGLIGGLVGGLVGGGALLAIAGFLLIRYRRKKNKIPLGLKKAIVNNHSKRSITPRQEEEMQYNRNSKVMSGVIPVAFVPPTASRAQSSILDLDDGRHASVSTFTSVASSQWQNGNAENPFDDHHLSTRNSIMTQSYLGGVSRRTSTDSNLEQPRTATVVQATQVVRAKPQIMRVDTVKIQDGVTRSASFKKTLKPEKEDPFDDKNKASSPSSKPTDSVVSGPADGEITIFWSGS